MKDLLGDQWTEPTPNKKRPYTKAEDDRIWEVGQEANSKNIGLMKVFPVLAKELNRGSAKAIEVRYYLIRKEKGFAAEPRRNYTEDDDNMILAEVERARENDLDLGAVWMALGERLDRAPHTIEVRYYHLIKAERDSDSIMSNTEASAILNRLRGIARDSAKIKSKSKDQIEEIKAERDEYKRERDDYKRLYEKLLKEIDQIRSYLDE